MSTAVYFVVSSHRCIFMSSYDPSSFASSYADKSYRHTLVPRIFIPLYSGSFVSSCPQCTFTVLISACFGIVLSMCPHILVPSHLILVCSHPRIFCSSYFIVLVYFYLGLLFSSYLLILISSYPRLFLS